VNLVEIRLKASGNLKCTALERKTVPLGARLRQRVDLDSVRSLGVMMGRHQVCIKSGLAERSELLIKDSGVEWLVDRCDVNDPDRRIVLPYRFAFQRQGNLF